MFLDFISLFVTLFNMGVNAWACWYVAKTKGYNAVLACVLGLFFGYACLAIYLALVDNNPEPETDNKKTLITD